MDVVWSRIISASSYRDGAYSTCVYGDRVYAVGFDELHGYGRKRYRIEALRASDGTPLTRWTDDKSYAVSSLTACTSVGGNIYAFGATERFWSIAVFDKDLNLLKRLDVERPYIVPFSAFAIGKYIYVSGTAITSPSTSSVYVAKIASDDLSTVSSFTTDLKGVGAGAYAASYNAKSKNIVVGGFDRSEEAMGWLVVYLSEDLELIRISRPGFRGSVLGLAVGADGLVYLAGRSRVAKMGLEGEVITFVGTPQAVKVYASQESKLSIGANIVVAVDNEVYVLSNDTLSVVDSVRLSKGPQMLTTLVGSMDADNENIYIATTQVVTKDDWNWAIIALRSRGRRMFPRFVRR